jgi:hypothetical protein
MLFPLSRDQLLPLDLADVPATIAEANRIAVADFNAWERARQAAGEAGERAKAAPHHDAGRREDALAAGEEPPEPTELQKRAEAEEARKQAEAAEQVAKRRVCEFYDVIDDEYDPYLDSRRKHAEQAVEPLKGMPEAYLDGWVSARTAVALYQAACDWHNNPNSAAISAGVEDSERLRRRFARELEKQREQKQLRPDSPVDRGVIPLLAALALEAEKEGRS